MKDGRHPRVKSAGSVPYYMVFDQHGDIVHHHMAGAYHGGDGDGQVGVVEKLLKGTPTIYLGREPYPQLAKVAKKVGQGRKAGAALKPLEGALEAEPDEARKGEITRLLAAVEEWRDRQLRHAVRGLATRPSGVVPRLEELAKMLSGSALADEVGVRLAEVKEGDALTRAIAVEKSLAKLEKQLAKAKPCDGCKRQGAKSARTSCDGCRGKARKAFGKVAGALDELASAHADLPITSRVTALRAALGVE